MDKLDSKTNWRAVMHYLEDAFDYLEADSKESLMFRVQLEDLIDRAEWNYKHFK